MTLITTYWVELLKNKISISKILKTLGLLCILFLNTNQVLQAQVSATSDVSNCYAGDNVNFSGNDFSGGNVDYWDWDFGDGNYAYTQNTSHAFSSPGTYNVQLTVTYDDASTNTDYVTVTVDPTTTPPVANFDFNPSAPLEGDVIQFNDLSSNNPTSWDWDFGDGNTSNDQNPTHSYSTAGTYNLQLTAYNSDGQDTYYANVIVDPAAGLAPVANFDFNPSAPLEGDVIQFNDLSSNNPTSWDWDFGDGNTSNDQNPTHSYPTAGTYNLQLTAYNSDGQDTYYANVIVDPASGLAPVANFDFNPSAPLEGDVIQFNDLSSNNPTSWDWDFGDGNTSNDQNPTHSYSTAGTYNLQLTAYNSDGQDTYYANVTVDPASGLAPVANFDFNPSAPLEGDVIQFNDLSSNNPTSWDWDFGDGNTSNDQNPTHSYSTAGTYNLQLTAYNSDGQDTYYANVTVDPASGIAPSAYFNYSPTNPIEGETIQFSDQSANDPTSWSWDFGDGSGVSSQQDPSYSYATAGTYNVQLTVSNSDGSDVYSTTIVVDPPTVAPIASFDMDAYYGTAPFTINVFDQSMNGPDTWAWDFGDPSGIGNTSNSAGPLSFTYDNPGTYVISLTASNSFGSDTYTTTVIVDPAANMLTAQFSADNYAGDAPLTVQFNDESTNNPTSWAWDFGDPADPNNTSSSNGPVSFTYVNPGDYVVSLNVQDGTNSDTYTTTISVTAAGSSGIAAFSSDVTSGDAPLTVYFQDESANYPNSWNWDFGNYEYSTDQNASTTYADPGTYIVTLQVDNASTVTHTIQVNNSSLAPVANFSTDVMSGTAPLTVNFTDQTTNNPESWNWDMGDYNNSTEQNTTYIYTVPGTYVVALTADNSEGSSTHSVTILVSSPNTTFTADKFSGDFPLTVNFSDQTPNATQWEWDFGNSSDVSNNTTNLQNPAYTYTAAGSYLVKLKAGDSGVLDSTTAIIEVSDPGDGLIKVYSIIPGTEDSSLVYDESFDGMRLTTNPPTLKICADGAASTVLYCYPQLNIDVNNLVARIQSDPNGSNPDQVGKILTTSIVDNTQLRVEYQSPIKVDVSHLNDNLEFYDITTQQVAYTVPIKYFNAPIVMLHGLWSDASSFQAMKNNLQSDPTTPSELLTLKDYKISHDAHFSQNVDVVASGVNEALKAAVDAGYCAGKVDLIGHSMGGILSRLYIQSDGKIFVHKLITLNTPHSGSQMADLLSSQKWYGSVLRGVLSLAGKSPYNGAVEDLKTAGSAIANLNSGNNCVNVPCHAISTNASNSQYGNTFGTTANFANSIEGVAQTEIPNNQSFISIFLQNLFSSKSNDLIVAIPSQEGGLSGSYVSQFSNQIHMGSPANASVINKVKILLQEDPNGPSFNQSGYNAPIITPYYQRQEEAAFVNQGGGSVHIISPVQSLIVHPGDIVPITVTSTGSFKRIIIGVGNNELSDNYGYYKDSLTNYMTLYYKVPPIYSGKLKIGATAYDTSGYASDSLNLFVNPSNLQLDSISIKPKKLFIQKGGNSSLQVTGYYKGVGAIDISSMNNVSYSSSNYSITSHLSNSTFKGKHKGNTSVSVVFNGKSKQVPVSVIDSISYSSIINSVKENNLPNIKTEGVLIKVYPNPSNGISNVDYTLRNNEQVKLDLFDLNGKLVKSILNSNQSKGSYTQTLDCNSLANGVYIIKIQSGTKCGYSKLIIAK